MQSINILKTTDIERTARVIQVESLMDITAAKRSESGWKIDFDPPEDWNVGAIVGPSGCGKSTMIHELFPKNIFEKFKWSKTQSILDAFPSDMKINDIVKLLSSIGFSSPPSWLRPFSKLSNGEQFRVHIARAVAESDGLIVLDEFTSVVDRNVAKIASAAIGKMIRALNRQIIVASCHYDILDWLEADWVFEPHQNTMQRGSLRRPKIKLHVERIHHKAWRLFARHHYLNAKHNSAALCFGAFIDDVPVAFTSWLYFPHPTRKKKFMKEHRTVVLPDYQGVGIGNRISDAIASAFKALGYASISTTTHPSFVRSRAKNDNWIVTSAPFRRSIGMKTGMSKNFAKSRAINRLVTSFRYVGEAMSVTTAEKLTMKSRLNGA